MKKRARKSTPGVALVCLASLAFFSFVYLGMTSSGSSNHQAVGTPVSEDVILSTGAFTGAAPAPETVSFSLGTQSIRTPEPVPSLVQAVSSLGGLPDTASVPLFQPGTVIENFSNTWDISTIGLVYDPSRGYVRYAHETTPNPTIYDVDYPVPHTVLGNITLSSVNAGWPQPLDHRDGAGYDATTDTYFLPDYQGDLINADDNIVEISPSGVILNAWETDNSLGSNDSYDATAIDMIIDIAIVPGSPTRYFATAASDGSVVYEIDLIKTGSWWTPNTWGTLNTFSVPGLSENMGIDYDAEHGVLYHSDFKEIWVD